MGKAMQQHHRALVWESCVTAIAVTFGIAALGRFSPATIALVGCIAGLGGVAIVTAATSSTLMALSVLPWALWLPGWAAYATATRRLWHGSTEVAGLAGCVVCLVVTLVLYGRYLDDDSEARRAAEARRLAAELARWGELLADLGIEGVRAVDVATSRTGRIVSLRLPPGGSVTVRTLQQRSDNLAVALGLPPGCVSFTDGDHTRREVLMRLDEHQAMAEPVPYPRRWQVRSINDPITLGVRASGRPARVLLREVSVFLAGVTGAGKSNALNVLISELAQCKDGLVFVIDLAGGRLAAPWIRPWVEGRCDRPAVDWVADNRKEAWLMIQALDRMLAARDSSLIGGSKITPGDAVPQVVIIVDETADVTGAVPRQDEQGVSPAAVAAVGAKLTRRVRKAAMCMVWALTKGTADNTGSTLIRSQCRMRWSMAVSQESDARVLTDNQAIARLLVQAQHAGSMVIEYPGEHAADLVKVYRQDPAYPGDAEHIDALAEWAGAFRPQPAAMDLTAMGAAYSRRWERSDMYQAMLAAHAQAGGDVPPPRPQQVASAVATVNTDTEARRLLESAGLGGGEAPSPRGRMYALLAGKRLLGMSVAEIVRQLDREGLGVARETVHRWLKADLDAGKVTKTGEGKNVRYRLS